jgi:hypothetical protein
MIVLFVFFVVNVCSIAGLILRGKGKGVKCASFPTHGVSKVEKILTRITRKGELHEKTLLNSQNSFIREIRVPSTPQKLRLVKRPWKNHALNSLKSPLTKINKHCIFTV